MEEPVRKLIFFRNYFREFFGELPPKVREKFSYVLYFLEYVERVPTKFLKHIEGSKGLYEIRVEAGSDIYRAFCFFDKGRLVILVNGFHKKSQKTPTNEIELAERLMKEYFDNRK